MTALTRHLTDSQAQRLVDGALSPAEASGIELHLAGCAECLATVESYRLLASALEDLGTPQVPDDFTDGVLARIDARERSVARERRHALAIFVGVLAAAVAAFFLAGPSAWVPEVSSLAEAVGSAARALEIGESFVPAVVGAFRVQILVVAALAALPLLLALALLVPAPDAETA